MKKITEDLMEQVKNIAGEGPIKASDVYQCIVKQAKQMMKSRDTIVSDKKLYYISAEFLIGKMLTSNLINLGVYEEVKQFVEEQGLQWKDIQDQEKEPSLGNGGLGRLAACFLDSIASLQLCGDGIGLFYHFGLFDQCFRNHKQEEVANTWCQKESWFTKRDTSFQVHYPGMTLHAIQYDMDVIGYGKGRNTLHLYDVEGVDESLVTKGIEFDKTDIKRNLTLFLYPDDSDDAGRLLRIYQQYFMVSCGAQHILADCKAKGFDLHNLHQHAVIQINDTHPSLIIAEFIRLLMKEGLLLKEALHIVEQTCAYTNHTILAEALETWPLAYLQQVVPELLDIIMALDAIANQRSEEASVQIIDSNQNVHMAHMDIHFGKSVNGVAALHTSILENSELHSFYTMYPEKFNNKTNGITFRRWLGACNPQLYSFLNERLGGDVLRDENILIKLLQYENDQKVLDTLLAIKQAKKQEWVEHIQKKQGVHYNAYAIFDTQVKRLHEYKRQQMNALFIIHTYLQIRKGILPKRPLLFIFGAKAAPAYTIAKDIIHLLLCLQDLIQQDPRVSPYIQMCCIENYNVSEAEIVIPASDISEQISLASKEASGTGNMKFMLNGALTLGTHDGANVEIANLLKEKHIYLFGESSGQVIAHYDKKDYCAKDLYLQDTHIHELVDFIVSDTLCQIGDKQNLQRLYYELINKDWFMTLLDINAYITCKEKMLLAFEDRQAWAKSMLYNIAFSGYFSSDRTIKEYNRDIWKLTGGKS